MAIGNKKKKEERFKSVNIYQLKTGEYLPESSQPDIQKDYAINSSIYTPHHSTRYINVSIGDNGLPVRRNSDGILIEESKELPELYTDREKCCGCSACSNICPMHAINMLPCEEGFLYPVINAEECIRCYKCIKVCPFNVTKHS